MTHHRRLSLVVFVLLMLAFVLPAVPPSAAQSSVQILCYRPNSDVFADCANLAAAGSQQDPPWNVDIATGLEFGRFTLGDYAMLAISRFSADTLGDEVKRIGDYVRGGGKLLLLDPDFAALLDETLAAPTAITRENRPSELTRAGRFTPNVGGLAADNLPSAGNSIVPISTLGEAWIPQTRAGFGELQSTTLASAVLGQGRVTLAPAGLTSVNFAQIVAEWICCIVLVGPNMSVNAIEVTQAIQDLNNSVDLVAGKRTYVRVHVSSPTTRSGVTATLTARRNGVLLGPTLTPINPGGTITVKPFPNRGQLNDSFLFEMPASWRNTTGNLQLTARIDPGNTVNDLVLSNNSLVRTVNFLSGPTMRLRLYNVRYTVSGTTHQASNFHLNALESWLRRAYPIANLSVTRRNYTYPTNGLPNVDTLNSNLAMARLFDIIFSFGGVSTQAFYYGIVDDGGGFMRGKALGIPGSVSSGPTGTPGGGFGWDTDGSYGDWYGGHEIAHSLGRSHAEFCGAGGGTSFPYSNGRISPSLTGNTAIFGFDITNRTLYPPDWRDVMTYCSNQWVSDFTYEGMRQRFVAIGAASLASAELQQGEYALITGRVQLATGTGTLDEIHVLDGTGTTTTTPGDWSLVLLNGTTELAAYPFTPARIEDDDDPTEPALFGEMVPWEPGTTRIELRNGETVVDERDVSANAPTVAITAPTGGALTGQVTVRWTGNDADGDSLTYALLYSNDDGASWRTLANDLAVTELTVDTANLPGGTTSRFRVIATDGVLSGQADSALLSVPEKDPVLTFVAPEDGAVFFPTQPVALEATADDLEDGTLEGAALTWSSDRDGDLGAGELLITDSLSTGTHQITVTATDSDGQTAGATRTITIAEATEPLEVELALAPDVIGAVTAFGGPAQTFVVNTSAVSDGTELNWSAQRPADDTWVQLQSGSGTPGATASGSTPASFNVIVDPTGLPVGNYNTTITFTAGDTTRTITVNLIVEGTNLFLPLIRR